MLDDVDVHPGPQWRVEAFPVGAADDLLEREVRTLRELTVEKGGRDPYLVGDGDDRGGPRSRIQYLHMT
jgi:hypothetical protein